jgi:RNA polymerase sigma-70 factor (ECF subfamily)
MRLSFVKGEQQLVKDCLRGKVEAQRALYERYAPVLLPVCMRYARERAEAEDILQEGFIRVFDKLGSWRQEGSLEGWIRKIVVNVAIRQYQRNAKLHVVSELDAAEAEPGQELPDGQLHFQELLGMVQALPDGYRLVFNLFAMEGFSHAEIAENLGITEATSRSQLARARRILMRMVETQMGYKERVASLTANEVGG